MADSKMDKLKSKLTSAKQTQKPGEPSAEKTGILSGPSKMPAVEEKIKKAKEEDVEDTREETSGDERHDLIIPTEPNIPPSIVQERLRNGQNPATGEPWTRQDRIRYDKQNEQVRQIHARAVRESEDTMRREAAENAPGAQIQPVTHIPTAHLTPGQRVAMQKAQDSGKGPVAQAATRDQNHPDEIGRRQAEADMTNREQRTGVDEEVEKDELKRREVLEDEQREDESEEDADDLQRNLDEHKK